jgi:DNA (cytosine-5)-methyltransferase 1
LFCGAGGFSLGLLQAGYEVLAGLDNDPDCMLTYLSNLGSYPVDIQYLEPEDKERATKTVEGEMRRLQKQGGLIQMPVSGSWWIRHNPEIPPIRHFFLGDIRKVSGERILKVLGRKVGEVDLVVGSPPCQGFSVSGKRNVMDPRNSLVFEFARLVLEIQPKVLCMENVPGILSMTTPEGVPVVDALCRVLEDGSFGPWEALRKSLLTSAGVGAALKGSMPKNYKKQAKAQDDEAEQPALFEELA